ncbi:MAG: PD-(D/E)XK nuclease family protein [Phycisphaeraceae bacterium]|nr:PD-(D/E)XK nuclease family protein [Phycisphaeraceae bacterium]
MKGKIQRVFLGWDSPGLAAATAWLWEQYGDNERRECDLSHVSVLTTSARAGKRLIEHLVDRSERSRWLCHPPRLLSPQELAETFYQPPLPIAPELPRLLTWARTLREQREAEGFAQLARAPAEDDFTAWMSLGHDLDRTCQAVAAEGLTLAEMARKCERLVDDQHFRRWSILARWRGQYVAALAEHGWVDRDQARLNALRQPDQPSAEHDGDLVLLATPDLPPLLRPFLQRAAEMGGQRIFSLIHAPQEETQAFDDLGCLIPAAWLNRPSPIPDDRWRIVDRPIDQAQEVLRLIAFEHERDAKGELTAEKITVGLADAGLGPLVEGAIVGADVAVRTAAGRAARSSSPVMLLEALADFLAGRRLRDFARLLRHPRVEARVASKLGPFNRQPWLALVDQYIQDHLDSQPLDVWLGKPENREKLKAIFDAVTEGLPFDDEASSLRPPAAWAPVIAGMVDLYHADLDENDRVTIGGLTLLGEVLSELAEDRTRDDQCVTLETACRVVLGELAHRTLADPTDEPAVEMRGWLELPLDDAPLLILTGVNEGHLPARSHADAFLPDSLRRQLGLTDAAHRYARDMLFLTTLAHSRPHAWVVSARVGLDDEPLPPSRLLLACGKAAEHADTQLTLAHRVNRFYQMRANDSSIPAAKSSAITRARPTDAPRDDRPLALPWPMPKDPALKSLSVTALRDYLACPYRFYLKHVQKLKPFTDGPAELDARTFGNLAHSVLAQFGLDERITSSTQPDRISAFLSDRLDRVVLEEFGSRPPAAVRIQQERLRYRLAEFAKRQAARASEGWQILPDAIERKHTLTWQIDGQSFEIHGKIDRIDVHPELGCCVLDYKTGEQGHTPEKNHCKGKGENRQWIDLQLPLYREMARRDLAKHSPADTNIALGYVRLPKKTAEIGVCLAKWTPQDVDEAVQKARDVVSLILRGVFWPPAESVNFEDGLEGLCMDDCLDRQAAIESRSRQHAGEARRRGKR